MLTKCVNCKFFIIKSDSICPNCGLSEPIIELHQNETVATDMGYLYAGIAAFAVSIIVAFISQKISIVITASIFILSFLICTMIILERTSRKETHNRFSKEGFKDKEKIIEKRISELLKRFQNIETILAKIKETDSRNLQNIRSRLLEAREIIVGQFARYELQAKKIEAVRLQNILSPYLVNWNRLNEYETENGLVTIANTQHEISKIREVLTDSEADKFPEKFLPEKLNFIAQLDETEMNCEKLREALLSRQAARALQDISPIEESLKLPNADEIIHAAETFNIQTTLTDFSESFEELEREYQRLKAEENIEQKLLKN